MWLHFQPWWLVSVTCGFSANPQLRCISPQGGTFHQGEGAQGHAPSRKQSFRGCVVQSRIFVLLFSHPFLIIACFNSPSPRCAVPIGCTGLYSDLRISFFCFFFVLLSWLPNTRTKTAASFWHSMASGLAGRTQSSPTVCLNCIHGELPGSWKKAC